jgi:hypothetical protein
MPFQELQSAKTILILGQYPSIVNSLKPQYVHYKMTIVSYRFKSLNIFQYSKKYIDFI